MRFSGDPDPANNGLFTLYNNHLARYTPFGGWRTQPTAGLTDRGFTGHKQNGYIKLIDMRARWYDPAIGRFYLHSDHLGNVIPKSA